VVLVVVDGERGEARCQSMADLVAVVVTSGRAHRTYRAMARHAVAN